MAAFDWGNFATELVKTAGEGYTAKQAAEQAEAVEKQERWISGNTSDPSPYIDDPDDQAGFDGQAKAVMVVGGVAVLGLVMFLMMRK